MKSLLSYVVFLGLLGTIVYADEMQRPVVVEKVQVPLLSTANTKIQEIDERIKECLDFIENQPKRLQIAEDKILQLKNKSTVNQERIMKYTAVIRNCSTKEQNRIGQKNCNFILESMFNGKSYGSFLSDQKSLIEDAITYIDNMIVNIKKEGEGIPFIKDQIAVLENMKKALLGDV